MGVQVARHNGELSFQEAIHHLSSYEFPGLTTHFGPPGLHIQGLPTAPLWLMEGEKGGVSCPQYTRSGTELG